MLRALYRMHVQLSVACNFPRVVIIFVEVCGEAVKVE